MWGSFVDRAAALAADLDKQLNESVGADADPNAAPSVSQKSQLPNSAASIPEDMAVGDANPDSDNAWNDDFAFDDDEEEEQEVSTPATPEVAVQPVDTEKAVQETPETEPAAPVEHSAPPAKEDDLAGTMDITTPPPLENGTPNPPEQPQEATPMEAEVDENEVAGEAKDKEAEESTEDAVVAKNDEAAEGGDDDTSPDQPDNTPLPTAASSMLGALASAVTTSTQEQEESTENKEDVEASKDEQEPLTTVFSKVTTTNAPSLPTPRTPAFGAAATSMFTSFAQKAESLAHQAETLVDHAVHNDTSNGDKQGPGMTSLLSSLAGGAVEQESSADHVEDSEAGWDADDFEVTESEDVGETAEPVPVTSLKDDKVEEKELPEGDTSTREEEQLPPLPTTDETPEPSSSEPPSTATEEAMENKPDVPTSEVPNDTTPEVMASKSVTSSSNALASSNIEDDPRYKQILQELKLREEQLTNKSMQLTELQGLMESQEHELKQKIAETKEEAKKRILRAKERCEAAEAKVKTLQNSGAAEVASQSELIQALREEGQNLAKKQSAMEQAVRAAKLESRDLADQLETEQTAKQKGLEKIAKLESELKSTKEFLASARKGESQAGKLEQNLLDARSDAEMKAATIMSLQQEIKELTAEGKELRAEMERTKKSAAQEAQQEKKTLRREHHDVISDLETKLRTTEREAGVREDALRHEVSELRKRWQDAVRRADGLSMDVQSSTAPLLRQLESMERQNRVRAANWAELETQLRTELEDAVIQNEKLNKERNDFKFKYTRMERSMSENEQDSKVSKRTVEEQASKISKLEQQVEEMEAEAEKKQEEYIKVERLANEGVMRVRSEMTQAVVDSEERYRGQIERLEEELKIEREKRSQLESQVEDLVENAGMIVAPQTAAPESMIRREAKPKKLRKAEGQAEILAGALGFDSDSDEEDEESLGHPMDRGNSSDSLNAANTNGGGGMNSFAALEQLTSKLKVAKVELDALRKNLVTSEKTRESLVEELAESRTAKEKLPLFEAKVKELTQDNQEKELEIQGLREDISEVKQMYRTQLNILLEEKVSDQPTASNGPDNTGPALTSDTE